MEGTRLPDDFGGLDAGLDVSGSGPALLATGREGATRSPNRPSDFFAGERKRAELTATAYDPETGRGLDMLVIQFFARGRA